MTTQTKTAQHTPGPWVKCHDLDGDYAIFAGEKIIAITDTDSEEDRANASLIESAPEMLQALESELEALDAWLRDDSLSDDVKEGMLISEDKLQRAIQKARGGQ